MKGALRKAALGWLAGLVACAAIEPGPVPARIEKYSVPATPAQVLDAAVEIAPGLGLQVRKRSSADGSIDFRHAELSAAELQTYCFYPGVKDNDPTALQTFAKWSLGSIRDGFGPVTGTLELSLSVYADSAGGSAVSTRTSLTAGTEADRVSCRPRGTFQESFRDALDARLAS